LINCLNCNPIDVKSGQIQDMVHNSGQFSVPNDLVLGQDLKIRDCPEKFGTDGHLTGIKYK